MEGKIDHPFLGSVFLRFDHIIFSYCLCIVPRHVHSSIEEDTKKLFGRWGLPRLTLWSLGTSWKVGWMEGIPLLENAGAQEMQKKKKKGNKPKICFNWIFPRRTRWNTSGSAGSHWQPCPGGRGPTRRTWLTSAKYKGVPRDDSRQINGRFQKNIHTKLA